MVGSFTLSFLCLSFFPASSFPFFFLGGCGDQENEKAHYDSREGTAWICREVLDGDRTSSLVRGQDDV